MEPDPRADQRAAIVRRWMGRMLDAEFRSRMPGNRCSVCPALPGDTLRDVLRQGRRRGHARVVAMLDGDDLAGIAVHREHGPHRDAVTVDRDVAMADVLAMVRARAGEVRLHVRGTRTRVRLADLLGVPAGLP